jgi:4-amino-4-deoxychorismate lyase
MILVNGEARSTIGATDRGLFYGDGVFRTFPAINGRPLHWNRHYAKLAHDCAALALRVPDAGDLERDVATACESHQACTVKIIVTRGAGRRGYAYDAESAALRVVIADAPPRYPCSYSEEGIDVVLCRLQLGVQPLLAGVKHLNRLENVLARAEWSGGDIAEGILLDAEGHVVCGTMTNLFIVSDSELLTPRLDRCGVAGVTRDRIIDAAAREGIPCRTTVLSWDAVLAAEEVFLVNSLAGVWPVRAVAGHTRARDVGPVTRRLQSALVREDDAQTN